MSSIHVIYSKEVLREIFKRLESENDYVAIFFEMSVSKEPSFWEYVEKLREMAKLESKSVYLYTFKVNQSFKLLSIAVEIGKSVQRLTGTYTETMPFVIIDEEGIKEVIEGIRE